MPKLWTRYCALHPTSDVTTHRRAEACPRPAQKTATNRSLRYINWQSEAPSVGAKIKLKTCFASSCGREWPRKFCTSVRAACGTCPPSHEDEELWTGSSNHPNLESLRRLTFIDIFAVQRRILLSLLAAEEVKFNEQQNQPPALRRLMGDDYAEF